MIASHSDKERLGEDIPLKLVLLMEAEDKKAYSNIDRLMNIKPKLVDVYAGIISKIYGLINRHIG